MIVVFGYFVLSSSIAFCRSSKKFGAFFGLLYVFIIVCVGLFFGYFGGYGGL